MGHDDTLAGSRPEQLEEENDMSGSGNKIDVALTAELRGSAFGVFNPDVLADVEELAHADRHPAGAIRQDQRAVRLLI